MSMLSGRERDRDDVPIVAAWSTFRVCCATRGCLENAAERKQSMRSREGPGVASGSTVGIRGDRRRRVNAAGIAAANALLA